MSIRSVARAIKERLYPRQPLGYGGMGQVYQQRGLLGRKTAIKIPHPETAQRGRAAVETEALILRDLLHPNILKYLGHAEDFSSLKTELVEGITLREYFYGKGRLPTRQVLLIFKEVVSAVAHVHDKGYVHADLKWTNVLKTKDGIKLIDFDLARPEGVWLEAEIANPRRPQLAGTPSYFSPLRIKEGCPANKSDDILALGLMLFETLTGERAIRFQGKLDWKSFEEQLIAAHQRLQFLIGELEVPDRIKVLLRRMIGLFGYEQFHNCYEILEAIDTALAAEEII